MIYDLQESLYAIQTNIVKREQMIKEASGHDVTMSEDKVKNVFVKWEEVSNTSNSLRPVLQVINITVYYIQYYRIALYILLVLL